MLLQIFSLNQKIERKTKLKWKNKLKCFHQVSSLSGTIQRSTNPGTKRNNKLSIPYLGLPNIKATQETKTGPRNTADFPTRL